MSTVTEKNTQKKFAKNIAKLLKNHKIASSGTGNPFWTVDLDELTQFDCSIALSKQENVYLIPNMKGVKDDTGNEMPAFHINLGSHFDAIQTYEEQIGETITVNVAVRSVNPSITQEDLDRVQANVTARDGAAAGARAIASYTRAKASGEQTIVLVNYKSE